MDVIDLTKTLVSIPSILGNTSQIEEFVLSRLEKVGSSQVELVPVGNLGNNVLASVIHDEKLPTIMINGHLDTVDICKGWTRDPFKSFQDGDRLYGLGSADMKSGVALGMLAFEKLAKSSKANVIYAGSIDEEGDSAGAFALLERGIKADLCLIPEPSGGSLMMGCRGRVVFDVSVRGASAHGSRPEQGVNAITEAGRFACALERLPLMTDDKLGKGSFCPLEISGGTRTLSVPDSCRLKIDRHHVRGEDQTQMLQQLKEMVTVLNSHATFDITYLASRPTPFLEPYLTANEGLAKIFTDAVGGKFTYGKSVGDYNAFSKRIPTVVYGPHGENWHAPDEWVSIRSILECQTGYERFMSSLQSTPG